MISQGHIIIVVLLSIWTNQGTSVCNRKVLATFKNVWRGKAPTNLMEWSVGRMTYVLADKNFLSNYKQLKNITCFQTIVDKDKTDSWDEFHIKESKDPLYSVYDMIMEEPGVFTVINPGYPDAYMYVFYLKNDVLGFYECSLKDKTYVPGFGIGVKNYKPSNKKQEADIEEAKKQFINLKLFPKFQTLSTKGCK